MELAATSLAPVLTPHGRLLLEPSAEAQPLAADVAERLQQAFAGGDGHGLLQLGAREVTTALPAVLGYWRDFGKLFVTAVCTQPGIDEAGAKLVLPASPRDQMIALAAAAPPMTGGEALTFETLEALWHQMGWALRAQLGESQLPLSEQLKRWSPGWNLVGRVHVHLAENRLDEEAPFAFLATYTPRLLQHGKAQHLPLGEALREYAGEARREQLLSLLLPVQRAAAQCDWLRAMVDSGEIFHPLRWTADEAYRLLQDVPKLETAGVVVRVPGAWKAGRPPRPQVTGTVGAKPPSGLGTEALLDFRVELTLDGERLTSSETQQLLRGTEGLAFIRGRWLTVDPERLREMLERFESARGAAAATGLSFAEAMRLVAGAAIEDDSLAGRADPDWSRVVAGPWLAETLQHLRVPDGAMRVDPAGVLTAPLRPYQEVGARWLYLLSRLGLGACLADDMGLGKTIQVLALLATLKRESPAGAEARPSLLVAPASLLANWTAEAARFAPELRLLVAHPSAIPREELRALDTERLAGVDLVATSYGTLLRLPLLEQQDWRLLILDEAQAIKNPSARQTRVAKKLRGQGRIALTGTPVENRLSDLWSIFDFANPGLLGSAKEFTAYTKKLAARPTNPYEPLRALLRPYLLRRLKTDKAVIADLPEKTEVKAFCLLSRKQAALYQRSVQELTQQVKRADGIQRKGRRALLPHPLQADLQPPFALARRRRLGGEGQRQARAPARDRGDRGRAPGEDARLHPVPRGDGTGGGIPRRGLRPARPRAARLDRCEAPPRAGRQFQEDEQVPFFVLSLKAGGTGLNLTAASHVVHFDRWWNPAVEDQATDRAFRIGQRKNVLVHKFVCRGTVEEKIDALIESKQKLSKGLLEGGAELLLTEMSDDELLRLVALDLRAAAAEE